MELEKTKLTITKAAKSWHITRQTIYSKMKSGDLSYELNDDGKRQIDVSEMRRVFGEPDAKKGHSNQSRTLTDANDILIDTLKEQLALANKRIDSLEFQLRERDSQVLKLLQEVQTDVTRLIEHKPVSKEVIALPDDNEPVQSEPVPVEPPPKPEKKKSRLLRVFEAVLD